jgi:hypothetical protein
MAKDLQALPISSISDPSRFYRSFLSFWSIFVTGRADNEAAIRHVAEICAHAE